MLWDRPLAQNFDTRLMVIVVLPGEPYMESCSKLCVFINAMSVFQEQGSEHEFPRSGEPGTSKAYINNTICTLMMVFHILLTIEYVPI